MGNRQNRRSARVSVFQRERAALKRFSPGEHVPIEFYSFAYRYLPDGWEKSMDTWATIVAGIAMMSPNAHNPQVRYGQALAEKRYSEARLERLLQAEGQVHGFFSYSPFDS